MRPAKWMGCLLGAVVIAGGAGIAGAKLPPLTEEQKAKAEETKAKTAHGDKVAAYKLCLSQNKVAERYFNEKGKGKSSDTPACQDPGPFVPPGAAAAAAAVPAAKTAQPAPAATPAKK